MWETYGPPLRAAAITAFALGLVVLLIHPPSLSGLGDLLALIGGAVAFILVLALLILALSGDQMPEHEFERLVERSEALARRPPPDKDPSEFDLLVMEAIDGLPEQFRELVANTPVIVSHLGREHHAYGLYMGDTVAREGYPDRIVIYQDTLERDFGHDPDLLRAQVERTVRHEMAHHLGWNESGVRGLGL